MTSEEETFVDHTYRDYSRFIEAGGEVESHNKCRNNFPAKLHSMVSDPGSWQAIIWMPHGRAIKVVDKDLFMSEIIPQYFAFTHFESFTRQLNAWGFKRMYRVGPDYGAYYHPCFLRGKPELTKAILRAVLKNGKAKPFPEGEPDLYAIAEQFPLPQIADSAQRFVVRETAVQEAAASLTSVSAIQEQAVLLSRPSTAPTEPLKSNVHASSQGIPQGSFSGPPAAVLPDAMAYVRGTEPLVQMMSHNFSSYNHTAAIRSPSQAGINSSQMYYGNNIVQHPYPTTHESFSGPPAAALPDAKAHSYVGGTETVAQMMQAPSQAVMHPGQSYTATVQGPSQAGIYPGQSYENSLQHPCPTTHESFSGPPAAAALPDAKAHSYVHGTEAAQMMQGSSQAVTYPGHSYENNLLHPYPMAFGLGQPMIQNQQSYPTIQTHYHAPAPGGYQVPSFLPTSQQHVPASAQVDFSGRTMMPYPYQAVANQGITSSYSNQPPSTSEEEAPSLDTSNNNNAMQGNLKQDEDLQQSSFNETKVTNLSPDQEQPASTGDENYGTLLLEPVPLEKSANRSEEEEEAFGKEIGEMLKRWGEDPS